MINTANKQAHEILVCTLREQQRLKQAYASAQSLQSLCCLHTQINGSRQRLKLKFRSLTPLEGQCWGLK